MASYAIVNIEGHLCRLTIDGIRRKYEIKKSRT